MLIDATHPEETRVVVVDGNRLEEFDFESASKRQLIGNIYLAKVMRVEPSLQAAFVEYGGNRHGFLAFNEIHPDYYQIPVADRQALLAQEAQEERRAEADGNNGARRGNGAALDEAAAEEGADAEVTAETAGAGGADSREGDGGEVEAIGGDDALEEISRPRFSGRRSYKIQEVIKKRQILLVQVMKDERGTKGAALTTYLSLPGRYCVLMPNTARGGGISRKITKGTDRQRLKAVATSLDVPEGMGLIIRTAGANRTKAEIKRDFEYLLRLWEDIRDRTLKSIAPALVHEESSLVKRAIRDLYTKDIDAILVDGEESYREAKTFMRMLMPSHAKNVQHYRDRVPLFQRYGAENQIDSMFNPVVQLRSGGYIVLSPTEALVSIDVNSGRATREHNIEDTAFKTNMEAAEEIARQLRLRDLAGLIVIDFIDMTEGRNVRAVERKLKDCLKSDRARIQVGRISPFGLLEMSRQRLRTGVVETTTQPCRHCHGTGLVRSIESSALHILRAIEEEALRERSAEVTVHAPTTVALYILNQKRRWLQQIEEHFALAAFILADETLIAPEYRLERGKARAEPPEAAAEIAHAAAPLPAPSPVAVEEERDESEEEEEEALEGAAEQDETAEADEDSRRKRRRRRRRRKRRGEEGDALAAEAMERESEDGDAASADAPDGADGSEAIGRPEPEEVEQVSWAAWAAPQAEEEAAAPAETTVVEAGIAAEIVTAAQPDEAAQASEKPARRPRRPRRRTDMPAVETEIAAEAAQPAELPASGAPATGETAAEPSTAEPTGAEAVALTTPQNLEAEEVPAAATTEPASPDQPDRGQEVAPEEPAAPGRGGDAEVADLIEAATPAETMTATMAEPVARAAEEARPEQGEAATEPAAVEPERAAEEEGATRDVAPILPEAPVDAPVPEAREAGEPEAELPEAGEREGAETEAAHDPDAVLADAMPAPALPGAPGPGGENRRPERRIRRGWWQRRLSR